MIRTKKKEQNYKSVIIISHLLVITPKKRNTKLSKSFIKSGERKFEVKVGWKLGEKRNVQFF